MLTVTIEPLNPSHLPKMQGDPWTRKKTVMVLAIADLFLAVFLIGYAGYRLLYDTNSEENGEAFFLHISSKFADVILSILYWIIAFGILSIQLVIAFLLLTATKDMTIDPDTMIKKCFWWRTTSFVFSILLTLNIFILVYQYYVVMSVRLKLLRLVISCAELVFRLYGVYFIGKFIRDLSTLFAAPMIQSCSSMPSSPIPAPRCPVTSQRGLV